MAEEFAKVRVSPGILRGRRITAKAGNTYYSFQGIPYAKPPVGALRFQVAQPLEPWDGVRDALKEGPPCPQVEWIMKLPYRGDEDCLYVNVYSPKLPAEDQTIKYPVMVWIHGGGFEVGSGDSDTYGPEYLVGEDVVVVTLNYRLGIFGFLSLDDGSVAYNVGMKDQVAALRWVKENITVFGGDPNNVTIFGESAGGASVHLHVLSPMSKGLFHNAIIQSGCALNSWALAEHPQEMAFQIARDLGSNATNTQELITFLSNAPARDLVEKNDSFDKEMRGSRTGSFHPTPERIARPGEEVFLPASPHELMEKRQYTSVPVMIGLTSKEGIIVLEIIGVLQNPESLKDISEHLEMLVPKQIDSKYSKKEIAEKIKTFYFGKKNINEKLVAAIIDIMTDTAVARGLDKTKQILSEGTSPVFYYNFDFSGKLNFYKHFVNVSELPGASHLDELGYLFATPFYKVPEVAPESREGLTRKRMLKLWTNFARTGNPTPELDPVIGVKWSRFTTQTSEYLHIGDTLSIKKNLNKERMDFWNNL